MSLGRGAIYWAFRGFDLPAGPYAWLPAYHCGVEVQAAIDAGLTPVLLPHQYRRHLDANFLAIAGDARLRRMIAPDE